MEKKISKMNISSDVLNGTSIQIITCDKCNKQFKIAIRNKHRQQKIMSATCPNCKKNVSIGDIYNFDTGKKLNKRLEKYNQETYDKKEWDTSYDII